MSEYWKQTAKEILREYRAHPENWREQPTIRKHLLAPDIDEQHELYYDLIETLCPESHTIIELGGGFGGLAGKMRARRGPFAPYVIADFREMEALQRALLGEPLGGLRWALPTAAGIEPPNNDSLFIATFSLSEMDLKDRAELEPVFPKFRSLFFAWTKTFRHIDNDRYFAALAVLLSATHELTTMQRTRHRHRYLIATRK